MEKAQPDVIISIGGGSVIDMAKLIRFFYSYDGDISSSNFIQKRKLIPLIAIPTTAGTGSEATRFAVVYKNNKKFSLDHSDVLPSVAIVDPVFTYRLPPYLTACAGFDALAQAIEAFWNVHATKESDEFAQKAIDLLWKNLPAAVLSGNDTAARNNVSEGSYYAGRAINITRTTAPHAFSYSFTTHYGYPHGHAVAMTFPFFMQYNYAHKKEQIHQSLDLEKHHRKMNYLYNMLDIDSALSAQKTLEWYIANLGLSLRLPENFNAELIVNNTDLQRLQNNPRIMNDVTIHDVINYLVTRVVGQ
jgi:alcohol dehydrogenase class IV